MTSDRVWEERIPREGLKLDYGAYLPGRVWGVWEERIPREGLKQPRVPRREVDLYLVWEERIPREGLKRPHRHLGWRGVGKFGKRESRGRD